MGIFYGLPIPRDKAMSSAFNFFWYSLDALEMLLQLFLRLYSPSDGTKDAANGVASGNAAAPAASGSIPSTVVKDDSVNIKSIFTNNIETSGADSARDESLKREKPQ